jgi:hypothetical protein
LAASFFYLAGRPKTSRSGLKAASALFNSGQNSSAVPGILGPSPSVLAVIATERRSAFPPAEKKESAAVNDLQSRIDQLEARSVESRLIADLATDPEARLYNTSLARELMDQAAKLRLQLPATHPA